MDTKVIFFNGPPRCGKDTAAKYLFQTRKGVVFDRFSMPCKMAFAALLTHAGKQANINEFGDLEPYESTKGDNIPWLGVSYRQWQIDFSEKFMKPLYGDDIFARLFIERNREQKGKAKLIVIPDSGFASEVGPIVDHFGEKNCLLVRTHRPGYDFTGDSRSYIYNVMLHEMDVDNDYTVDYYHDLIANIAANFLATE